MAIIGTAYIQIQATDAGFEASVVSDVEKATASASQVAKVEATADTSKATGPLDVLKSKIQSFAGAKNPVAGALGDIETASGGASGALSGLATGGIAIAGAAAVAFAVKSVSAFQDYAGGVRQIQLVTGATATQSSQLAAAFKAVGIAPDQAAPALGRFAKNLDTNAKGLGALGIQVTKTAAGNVDMTQTFLNVADSIAKSQDPSEKLNIAMTAFGKSGQSLLPILSQGRAGIQNLFDEAGKHGALFSQKDLDTSKELSMAWIDVKETLSAAFLEAGKVIAPVILDIVHIVQDVSAIIEKSDVLRTVLKTSLEVAFSPLILVIKSLETVSGWLDKISGQHHDTASSANADAAAQKDLADATTEQAGADQAAAQAADDLKKAQDAHNQIVKTLTSSIEDVTDAQHALTTANAAVTASHQAVAAAQAKLNDLTRAGTVNTQAVTQAQKDLASANDAVAAAQDKVVSTARAVDDATRAQQSAIQNLTDAQQAYDDLVSGKTAAADMAAHHNDLAHAQLSVQQATLSQSTAQQHLADLQASGTATATDLTQAQLDLESANLSLSDAQDNLAKTQTDLNTIQNEGKDGSDALKTATNNLQAAQVAANTAAYNLTQTMKDHTSALDDVTTAQQGVLDKQNLLNIALQPDPKLVSAIQTAANDVKTAQQGVRDAMDQASQKAADLGTKQQALNTLQHDSIPDLLTIKTNLTDIVNLQPQAAAFLGPTLTAINTLIAAAQTTVAASVAPIAAHNVAPAVGPASPIYAGSDYAAPAGASDTDAYNRFRDYIQSTGYAPPTYAQFHNPAGAYAPHAAGGYDSNSFIAGEHGPELIQMRPGGGAMVYAAGSPEARAGGLSAPTVTIPITAHFGPGTNADDVLAAMRSVAQNEMTVALQTMLRSANAGKR